MCEPLPSVPRPSFPAPSSCRRGNVRPREGSCKVKAACGPVEPRSSDSEVFYQIVSGPSPPDLLPCLIFFARVVFLFVFSLPALSPRRFSLSFYSLPSNSVSFYALLPPTLSSSPSLPCVWNIQSINQSQFCIPPDRPPAPVEGYNVYIKQKMKLLKGNNYFFLTELTITP